MKAVAVALSVLLLAGCTSSPQAEGPAPLPRVDVSGLPATFIAAADWSVTVRPGSTVQASDAGILVVRSAGAQGYVVSVLNPTNGAPRWVSVPIPVTPVAPRARFTTDDGHPWVVVESTVDATMTMWVFDAYASGHDVQPTQGRKFEGVNGKPPVVTVTDRGVLLTGLKDGSIVYRAASGVAQAFTTPGQVPIRSYGTSVLVSVAGGFGLIAERVGWLSKDRVPPGVGPGATATVVATGGAFVAAVWTSSKDKRITLALHELLTGQVRATGQLSPTDSPQPLVVARDGAWAAYGSRAFNLSTGAETTLNGGPYAFTQIQDSIAYGTATTVSTTPSASPSAAPSAAPSATPSASPSAAPSAAAPSISRPVAVDLLTGSVLETRTPAAVPSDFDSLGHGLFVVRTPSAGDDTLYAVSLKRWRP